MMELKVSDLFQKKGFSFDYDTRIKDQNTLIERLRAVGQNSVADELQEFAGDGFASLVFIEYITDKLKREGVGLT